MTCYASLADVRNSQQGEKTTDDNKFLFYARVVSRRIDKEMASRRPYFAPYIETRKPMAMASSVNSYLRTFQFNMPLLALNGVSIGGTELTVPTDVVGFPDADIPPYSALQLTDCYRSWYADCSDCGGGLPPQISISGIWGYHSNYAEAWQRVDALTGNINDSVTALTVADVDGDDPYGLPPRISAGNLLKIGDEMMEVADTNTTTNVVTVKRGVNGSTAAAHVSTDAVYVWYPEWEVRSIAARQAALMYARRGGYNAETPGDGNTTYPADLLEELLGVLQGYVNGT